MKKALKYIIIIGLILVLCFTYYLFSKKQNVNKVFPSVVHIECKNDDTISKGSGIIYKSQNQKYYIVTSYHIIKGYIDIKVSDEEKNIEDATIVNYDEDLDLAILVTKNRLNAKKANIDTSNNLELNEKVYILTSDLDENLSFKTKEGVITSTNEKINIKGQNFNTIQVNSDIKNGDSGSALINEKGKIIGMIFVKNKNLEDTGYALPMKEIMDDIEFLENENDTVNLGAVMANSTNTKLLKKYDLEVKKEGVVVLDTVKDFPLDKAGLVKGDVITKLDNQEINDIIDLKKVVAKLEKGTVVKINYYREKKLIKTKIALDK